MSLDHYLDMYDNIPGKSLSDKEAKRQLLTKSRLEGTGLIGILIANALSVQPMTPNELINCLMSEPYDLVLSEENISEFLKIINQGLLRITFRQGPGNLSVETLLSL